MELLEELKHAWGQKRKDTEIIKQKVLETFKEGDYKNVIELCSKLDYKKEPLNADVGYALCYSIWYEPGNDIVAFNIAKNCVEYYDEPRFKKVLSYAQEHWADTSLNNASQLNCFEFEKEVEENVIKIYQNALSWEHNDEDLKKRISEKMLKAYDTIGEKYYDRSLVTDDNWKDRPDRRDYLSYAIPYYEKAKNTIRELMMMEMIQELDAKIEEDNIKFVKLLKEFPEASGFSNKLDKAGYKTVGDLLKASETDIDNIQGIGTATMTAIKRFKNKF
ncbi:MAG: hypothetical protein P8I31_07970 [Bacteroidia bacterium]|nr:hypothetical protein [Bacteroidia bacterium]